jgi:hypothetical protein
VDVEQPALELMALIRKSYWTNEVLSALTLAGQFRR